MANIKPWAVRIDYRGTPVGAGTLVAPRWVLTCAHVVQDRAADIKVKFSGAGRSPLPVEVFMPRTWSQDDEFGDVAALRILTADADEVAPCRFAPGAEAMRAASTQELHAKGFPRRVKAGTHVKLETRWHRDIEDEWLEVSIVDAHRQLIDFGFSGAAVYLQDDALSVVGMLTLARMSSDKGGFEGRMLPLESIRKHWAALDGVPELDWTPARRVEPDVDRAGAPARESEDDLHAALPRIGGPAISENHQVELLRLVQQLERPALWRIYPKVTGPAGRPLGPESVTPAGLIGLVASLPVAPSDFPPLLKMAEWQAGLAEDDEIRAKLRSWVDRAAVGTGVSEEGVVALRKRVKRALSEESLPSYLMVRLEPSSRPSPVRTGADVTPPRFKLGLWLWGEAGRRRDRIDTDEFGELDLRQVEAVFREHLEDWVQSVDEAALGVEFFVPREHLGCGFDQWAISLWDQDTVLGREFLVTVRDAVRLELRRARTHAEWRRRWTALHQGGHTRLICQPMAAGRLRRSIKNADEFVCVAIQVSPDTDTDTVHRLAGEAFDAGLPAAIWVRGGDGLTVPPGLDEIAAGPAVTLPEQVRNLRRATDDETHLGGRLTLVWDDPDRRIDSYPADLETEV